MKQLIVATLILLIHSSLIAAETPGHLYEKSLLDTIKKIQSQNHDQAMVSTRDLIRQYPHSRLGHLLYADLLLAKAEPLTTIGSGINTADRMQDFQHEIQQRWQNEGSPAHAEKYPENILFMAENQPFVILVDQLSSRIYVYQNQQGKPVLKTDYFITIGINGYGKQKRGDQKTPIGIYSVTKYIDGNELPDLYGEGAFPIDYPNTWDKRNRRTGDGIWIHGTPSNTYNRSPWASNGCIVVSNPDFLHIGNYITPDNNTPIIVAKKVNWLNHEQWSTKRQQALKLIDNWISDWESLDHDRYSQHYSQTDLNANGKDFQTWETHKLRVNRNKTSIDVDLSNLSVYQYPGEENMMLMQFDQEYRSNNLNDDSPKEIYWRKSADQYQWQIVHEGVRKYPAMGKNLAKN